jgi:glutaredoxin 3
MTNKKSPTITVYSTTSCPYCYMAKDFLTAKGVPYRDVNVGTDRAAAAEMVQKSGQMGVPVIDIDGEIIVGFRPDMIEKLIA